MAAFVDQTGIGGYEFGARLPSAHMTYVMATVVPKCVNGDGGAYTLAEDLEFLEGAGGYSLVADNASVAALSCTNAAFENIPTITAYSEARWHPLHPAQGSGWSWISSHKLENATSGAVVTIPLTNLIQGQALTGWSVTYTGAGGHTGTNIAGTMPQAGLYRTDQTTDTRAFIELVDDSQTAKADYEVRHEIAGSLGGVDLAIRTVDLTRYVYDIQLTAEGATDFQAGATVTGVQTTQTVAQVRA